MESGILPPHSYYKLSVPVTPLPRALNHEAISDGSRFLGEAAQRHQRFLAMAFAQSCDMPKQLVPINIALSLANLTFVK
jgi:hypothetical protein